MSELFSYPTILLTLGAVTLLVGFAMPGTLALRGFSFLATLAFLVFAAVTGNLVLIVAAILFVLVTGYRFYEAQNISRKIRRTRHYGYEIEQLLPLMEEISHNAGDIIFARGDRADRLFVLTSGEVEIVENGTRLSKGTLFGEFGLFTGTGERTGTIRCVTPCTLRTMSSQQVDKLYFTQPEFALALVKIMATRMTGNIEQLQAKTARTGAADQ